MFHLSPFHQNIPMARTNERTKLKLNKWIDLKHNMYVTTTMPFERFEFAGLAAHWFGLWMGVRYLGNYDIHCDWERTTSKPTHNQTRFRRNKENAYIYINIYIYKCNNIHLLTSLLLKNTVSLYFLTKNLYFFQPTSRILMHSMLYIQTEVQCEDLEPDFCAASFAVGWAGDFRNPQKGSRFRWIGVWYMQYIVLRWFDINEIYFYV